MKTRIIDNQLLDSVGRKASASDRKRANLNFHQLPDPAQRFLNAIEPDSYIRPHRHIDPLKDEAFLVLKGRGAVIIFSDRGEIEEIIELDISKGRWGVDIPGGIYHTIVSLASGTVFYEVKPGPYDPTSDKGFAVWAPHEQTEDAVLYLQWLIEQIGQTGISS
ncbi:WbuC family cupin fold metalloprotein [bacterium]|nr:WbuC family cupin fold metalloprotein [bacterium]